MIGCDVTDCTVVALVALAFRGTTGHVHVCHTHERIDREHADVVRSERLGAFTGCPWCSGGRPGRAILGIRTPPLLP